MSDVSITDLIAKVREMPVGADWVTLTEDQSGWLHMHRAALVLADALEAVTVPTENCPDCKEVMEYVGTPDGSSGYLHCWNCYKAKSVPIEAEWEYGTEYDLPDGGSDFMATADQLQAEQFVADDPTDTYLCRRWVGWWERVAPDETNEGDKK